MGQCISEESSLALEKENSVEKCSFTSDGSASASIACKLFEETCFYNAKGPHAFEGALEIQVQFQNPQLTSRSTKSQAQLSN